MQPGDTRTVLMGFLEPELVQVLAVSREDFMAVVEKTLGFMAEIAYQDEDNVWRTKMVSYDPIRERMLAQAEKMDRFPLSSWMEPNRGCGCLVGEYLVANHTFGEYNRQYIANYQGEAQSIPDLLRQVESERDAELLIKFGSDIDEALKQAFVFRAYEGPDGFSVESLVIV